MCAGTTSAECVTEGECTRMGVGAQARRAPRELFVSSSSREVVPVRGKTYGNRKKIFKDNFGLECGVGVARSTLNTPRRQRARGGHKREVVEAGDGLFARRRFEARENVLDYAFMNGVNGERKGGSFE